MSLRKQQSIFAHKVALLIQFIYAKGYEVTFGDAFATSGHSEGSWHGKRLAIDLNLFKDGKYLDATSDHLPFGEFWESLGGTWGGRFVRESDGNHYSWNER